MARGRQLPPLLLDAEMREQLTHLSESTSQPHRVVLRAKMILAGAEGLSNAAVGQRVGASPQSVGRWRRRFLERGVAGLHDEPRPGRPRTYDDERVAGLINRALVEPPPGTATHWSTRTLAQAEGISQSTASRWLRIVGVKPHLAKTFQSTNDPSFSENVCGIVGLYLSPPEHAVVLCVGMDEKSPQPDALNRTQNALPLSLGNVEGFTHDNIRQGTRSLPAALGIATGDGTACCAQRHRHREYLTFLWLIDRALPAALDVHLIVDNYGTHQHPSVLGWLARHARFHVQFTPTNSSWINSVEGWLKSVSQGSVKRGTLADMTDLIRHIREFDRAYNKDANPFVWVAAAPSILDRIEG